MTVCQLECAVAIDQNGLARFNRNGSATSCDHSLDSPWTDRRNVKTHVLLGLGHFD